MCRILAEFSAANRDAQVPSEFPSAFAFHIYMLYSAMFFTESESKGSTSADRRTTNKEENFERDAMRASCAHAMLTASQSMCHYRSQLWQRGVADEAVVMLPCRIAYQMLEIATGVATRKAACAEAALKILAVTIDSSENLLNTIVPALIDLLHDYEHMATLVAELCGMVNENPTNRLVVELIREIGRLNTVGGEGGKASGIRNISPLISELARMRPRIVLAGISQILPHLNSEPYSLRSAIVTAIGHILVHIGRVSDEPNDGNTSNMDLTIARDSLFDILSDRVLDVSSFARGAVLKAWISIVSENAIPIDRILPITTLAADRLQDKTVMVRRCAMQVNLANQLHNVILPIPHLSIPSEALNVSVGAQSFSRITGPQALSSKAGEML